jgi:hypothetical protein
MTLFAAHSFPAKNVHSLSWRGEELVDWVGGGRSFALDGKESRASVNYAYRFDAATTSPDGRFAIIHERMGTKGLLLDNGKIVRELNRSFYCANAYEYPAVLFNDPSGRLLLAHCPEEYCRIELEEVETGRALTSSEGRKPSDFFHSRLAASPSGKRLLSAGWVWHPWSAVVSFDIEQALVEPAHLDRGEPIAPQQRYEEGSACWLDDDVIVIGGTDDEEDLDGDTEADATTSLCPRGLAVFDLRKRSCLRAFRLEEQPGTILPLGTDYVLSLYRHPKLIELATGRVLQVWSELDSGLQASSIIWGRHSVARLQRRAANATTLMR